MHDITPRLTRRRTLGLICAATLYPRFADAEPLKSISGAAFGTTWRIVGPSGAGLDALGKDIEALFADVDRRMSPWRRDGFIGRFNAGQSGWHGADDDVVHLTSSALALAEASGGAFDPTVGPLVARWGFGPIEGGAPNWKGLSVGVRRIAKTTDDLTLDLCGIAKGWALGRAVELARSHGLDALLLDLGGELAALGCHPSGRSWRVAVEHPVTGAASPAAMRLPPGWAAATSGLSTQSYTLGGMTYGHIIDPLSRFPAAARVRSVTVFSPSAMMADGWATALFAAGDEGGPALARNAGIAALFLVGDGLFPRQIRTGGIEDFLL